MQAAGTHNDDGFLPLVVPDFHMLGWDDVFEVALFDVLLDMLAVVVSHVDDPDSKIFFILVISLLCFLAFDALHARSMITVSFASLICLRNSSSSAAGHAHDEISFSSSVKASQASAFDRMSAST